MQEFFKANSVQLAKAKEMSKEELIGKIVVGEFVNEEKPGYLESYQNLQGTFEVDRECRGGEQ
jgi:2-oxoglutarate ferredoxin oxidoreductase subunit beta